MSVRAKLFAIAAMGILTAGSARADVIPYPNVGTENPLSYSFTATSNGPITAYFYGSGASLTSELGLLVNGVDTGFLGLNNQTSVIGDAFNFGGTLVNAGDELTFYIRVDDDPVAFYYSDRSLNADGQSQHVYSTTFSGGAPFPHDTIPAGVYVAFEDLNSLTGSDFNYNDLTFVFTNTSVVEVSETPLPAALPLFAAGLGAIGLLARRRKKKPAAA